MSRISRRPRIDHGETAQLLRLMPGTWLVVGDYRSTITADSVVAEIHRGTRSGKYRSPYLPAGAYEARSEPVEDGDTRVWARFVGRAS